MVAATSQSCLGIGIYSRISVENGSSLNDGRYHLESSVAERFMAELLATTADKYSGQLTDANACKISAIFAKFTDEVTLQVEQADFGALGCALYMQETV